MISAPRLAPAMRVMRQMRQGGLKKSRIMGGLASGVIVLAFYHRLAEK